MIGLFGDVKNNGQAIANVDGNPAQKGTPRNPKGGLIHASEVMFQAFQSNDFEAFSNALESYISMYMDIKEMDKIEEKNQNGYSHEMRGHGNNDSGGWK